MAETYPCKVAVVEGGVVRAVCECSNAQDRTRFGGDTATFTVADAKTISLPQSLRQKIIDALRASQDAADLAETGRALMAKSNRSGKVVHPLREFARDQPYAKTRDRLCINTWNAALCKVNDVLRGIDEPDAADALKDLLYFGESLPFNELNGSGGAPPDLGGPPAQLPPEPISIQRYDMITTQVGSCMSKRDDGDWVMFDDVEHLIGGTA